VRSSGRGFIQPSLAGFLFRTRRPLGVYRNVFYRFNIFFRCEFRRLRSEGMTRCRMSARKRAAKKRGDERA
jgi:hypothetical protein